jgi:hypothetical protein
MWPELDLIAGIIETTDRYAAAMVDAGGPRKIAP